MATQIATLQHIQSMDSLQISELVQSRHDSVKRTIERLSEQEVIEFPPTVEIKTATKPIHVYVFSGEQGKLDSITVVAQLCPQFTATIVKRWQQLERVVSADNYQALLTQNQALRDELLKARPAWADLLHYKALGLGTSEVSKLLGRANSTVCRYINTMQTLGYDITAEPQPAQLSLEV
ncbi:MAG: Rha family transcriptional regulator [Psychrobacter sp.]|nr:Rha family transcriptional regulator [Psychrobacter sp.]